MKQSLITVGILAVTTGIRPLLIGINPELFLENILRNNILYISSWFVLPAIAIPIPLYFFSPVKKLKWMFAMI